MKRMDQKEFLKQLKAAMQADKLRIGTDGVMALLRAGGASLIVVADNSPENTEIKKYAKGRGTEVFDFEGDSVELGKLCKKPFHVAALAISE